MRARRVAFPALLGLVLLWQGCTHDVAFQKPGVFSYGEKIPIDVAFFMKGELKRKTYEGRAWSSGIATNGLSRCVMLRTSMP